MRNEVKLWVEDAYYDLDCARDMLKAGRFNYVVWLARQAAEKALKAAYMHSLGKALPLAHNLRAIAEEFAGENLKEISDSLGFLNPHYTLTRYVDAAVGRPSELYDETMAQEALQAAEAIIKWTHEHFLS